MLREFREEVRGRVGMTERLQVLARDRSAGLVRRARVAGTKKRLAAVCGRFPRAPTVIAVVSPARASLLAMAARVS